MSYFQERKRKVEAGELLKQKQDVVRNVLRTLEAEILGQKPK